MMGCNSPAEEGNRTITLVKHSPESSARGITINHKWSREIWNVKNWRGHESLLQSEKCAFRVIRPAEGITLEERS
jgi:hypothetical protein